LFGGKLSSQTLTYKVDMILLLALVAQGAVAETYNGASQESKNSLVDPSARNLFRRASTKLSPPDQVNTTLSKPGVFATFPSSMKARRVLQTRAFPRSAYRPQFHGKGVPGQLALNNNMARIFQQYICPPSCARGSAIVKSSTDGGEADKMVAENRMITVTESNIRYAGALAIFLGLVNSYVGMQATGVYDYNSIAAGAAGAFLLFESGRRSF
jgi:hypothetical protein